MGRSEVGHGGVVGEGRSRRGMVIIHLRLLFNFINTLGL